jgi:hypothetical protein
MHHPHLKNFMTSKINIPLKKEKEEVLLPFLNPKTSRKRLVRYKNYIYENKEFCVSFESEEHNIYEPNFSSEDGDVGKDDSLEISFDLNDSYEELRLEERFSVEDKPRDRSLEPLFSVSPKADQRQDIGL